MKQSLFLAAAAACLLTACNGTATQDAACELERAKATLDTIYARYGVPENCLLRENHPFNADYKAGYLASEDQARPIPICGPSRARCRPRAPFSSPTPRTVR